jgi:ABC-2 type transport system ATP-binding protein
MAAIEVRNLTKRFGDVVAVDGLSFAVEPGTVVGFLGPNGAGKTTTLRALLGLVEPTDGQALVQGRRYVDLQEPLQLVGASLEASGFHPGRSARGHLRVQAYAAGVPATRVDEVLELVGLAFASDRRTGSFSLGMKQRLALATALLPDPEVLILDEPANGLDPEGVRWLRDLLRDLASQGRTVLVSSHVLAEVAQTVDRVVILSRGRLVAHSSLDELRRLAGGALVRVRTPNCEALRDVLQQHGAATTIVAPDRIEVSGARSEQIGVLAAQYGIPIFEINTESGSLEDVFFKLVGRNGENEEAA